MPREEAIRLLGEIRTENEDLIRRSQSLSQQINELLNQTHVLESENEGLD